MYKTLGENRMDQQIEDNSEPTGNEDNLKLKLNVDKQDAFKLKKKSSEHIHLKFALPQYTKLLSKSINRNYGTDNEIPLILKATPAAAAPFYSEKPKAELIDTNSSNLIYTQNKPIPLVTLRKHVKVNFNLNRVPLPCEKCLAAICVCKYLHRIHE